MIDGINEIPVLASLRTGPQPWAWHLILCEACNGPLNVSTTLLDGVTVHRCRQCRTFRIDGDTEIIKAGHTAMGELRLRAIAMGKMKVEKEIAESSWEDPRWEMII